MENNSVCGTCGGTRYIKSGSGGTLIGLALIPCPECNTGKAKEVEERLTLTEKEIEDIKYLAYGHAITQEKLIYLVNNIISERSRALLANIRADISKIKSLYPESVFTPITKQQLNQIHKYMQKEMGIPIDRLSAYYMRIAGDIVNNEFDSILSKYEEDLK
jgi:hypothetical protein